MKRAVLVLTVFVLALMPGVASATTVGIILTANKLGLGTDEINEDSNYEADVANKLVTAPSFTANTNLGTALANSGLTYPTIGTGSVLTIQESNAAGAGTVADPLLVRVT